MGKGFAKGCLLKPAVHPYHRFCQPVFVLCIIEAEPALDAEQAVVHLAASNGQRPYKHGAPGGEAGVAAHAAVRTYGRSSFLLHRYVFLYAQPFLQRSHRAHRNALSAGYAVRVLKLHSEFGFYYCVKAPVHKAQGGDAGYLVTYPDAQAAEYALVRVAVDKRVLVLKVGFSFGAAELSTFHVIFICINQQLAFKHVAAAAFHASFGLGFGFLLGIPFRHFEEVPLSCVGFHYPCFNPWLNLFILKVFLCQVFLFHVEPFAYRDNLSFQVSAYSFCGLFSLGYGFNGNTRAGSGIPAGEHSLDGGLECGLVVLQGAFFGKADAFKSRCVHPLAYGGDNGVHPKGYFFPLHRYGSSAAGSVRLAHFHLLAAHFGHFPVFAYYLNRCQQEVKLDTLFPGFTHFQLLGGHLLLGPPVYYHHLFCAQSYGSPGGVHGGVAAADNRYPFSYPYRLVLGNANQEVYASQHPFEVLSLTAYAGALPRAYAYIHRVEVFFKVVQRKVFAYPDAGVYFHAGLFYEFNFHFQYVLGQPVLRYAVPKHPARLWHGFVNDRFMPLPGKEICAAKAGGAAADYCHSFPGIGFYIGLKTGTFLQYYVPDKPFQGGYGYRLVNEIPPARIFTWVRAHPSYACGQRQFFFY